MSTGSAPASPGASVGAEEPVVESTSTKVNKSLSLVQQEDRMDQIIKVDTQALLKTIQDLEQRLTEYQRQDKPPAWAQALESRLEQIEKLRSSVSEDRDAMHKPDGTDPNMNLSTLTMEERILSRIRGEFETKLGNTQLHFEGIVSSNSLEMERLHKLLMIRPTTSELQQVMLAQQQQEQRTQARLSDIQNLMMSSMRDKISEEMISCVSELKNARLQGEEGARLVNKQIEDFTVQMNELREGAQNSFLQLQQVQEDNKALVESQRDEISTLQSRLTTEIAQVQLMAQQISSEMRTNAEDFAAQTTKNEASLALVESQTKTEMAKMDKKLREMAEKLADAEKAQVDLEVEVSQLKHNYTKDVLELRDMHRTADRRVKDLEEKQAASERKVAELIAQDCFNKLGKVNEQINKINFEIAEINNLVNQTVLTEIKANALKIALLQEQCNVHIPRQFVEHGHRLDAVREEVRVVSESIEMLRGRCDQEDELIDSLLPLKERVAALSETQQMHGLELEHLKEGLTSCIDANSEFARRLEECEEMIEGFEESINSRMNRIRDTLLDTLLEKQSETNQAVRNVRENLEVMAQAGDNNLNIGGSNFNGNAGGGGGGGNKGRSPTIVVKNGNLVGGGVRDNDNNASSNNLQGNLGPGGAGMKRMASYRIGNMQGQVVQGNAATPQLPPQLQQQPVDTSSVNNMPGLMKRAPSTRGGAGMLSGNSGGISRKSSNNLLGAVTSATSPGGVNSLNNGSNMQQPLGTVVEGDSSLQNSLNNTANSNSNGGGSSARASQILIPQAQLEGLSNLLPDSSFSANAPDASGNNAANTNSNAAGGLSQQQQEAVLSNASAVSSSSTPNITPGASISLMNNNNTSNSNMPRVQSANSRPQTATTDDLTLASPRFDQQNQQSHHQHSHHHADPQQGSDSESPRQHHHVIPHAQSGYHQQQQQAQQQLYIEMQNQQQQQQQHISQRHGHNHFDAAQEAQFLADLCLNYEELSVKRKRVAHVPPTFCASIAEVARDVAEAIAAQADFEMVEMSLAAIHSPLSLAELNYDEHYVVTARQRQQDAYVESVLQLVNLSMSSGGIVRQDARSLFVSLLRKALELFMTRHNQVLVAGNSRLGRVKIPTCIACDRPLLEKTKLDVQVLPPGSSPGASTRGLLEASAHTLRSGSNSWLQLQQQGGGSEAGDDFFGSNGGPESFQRAFPAIFLENSVNSNYQQHNSNSHSNSGAGALPGRGILGRGLLLSNGDHSGSISSSRPRTVGATSGSRGGSAHGQHQPQALQGKGNLNSNNLRSSATLRPTSSAAL